MAFPCEAADGKRKKKKLGGFFSLLAWPLEAGGKERVLGLVPEGTSDCCSSCECPLAQGPLPVLREPRAVLSPDTAPAGLFRVP